MSQDSEPSRSDALAFLQDIEDRHNQVLEGLDELNQQIEGVLSSQLTGGQQEAEPSED